MQINLRRTAPRGCEAESKQELIAWRGTLETVGEKEGLGQLLGACTELLASAKLPQDRRWLSW